MIFQGLSVTRNCLRPETAPLTILAIKTGLLCNFAKKFKGHHSSNVNEVIRPVLNLLLFFDDKILHAQKAQKNTRHQKTPKSTKKYKNTTKQKRKTQMSQ